MDRKELHAKLRKDYESGDFSVRDLEIKWNIPKTTICRLAKNQGWDNTANNERSLSLSKESSAGAVVKGAFKGKTLTQIKVENPHLVIDESISFDALTDIKNCSQALLNARRIIDVVGERLAPSRLKKVKVAELKLLAETNNAALATIIRMRELTTPYDVVGQDSMDPTVYNMALNDRDDLPNLIEQDAEGDLQQDVGPVVETRKSLLHSG